MQVLESEVCFDDPCGFYSGSQHILLSGNIRGVGYPVQVIKVTMREESVETKIDNRLKILNENHYT